MTATGRMEIRRGLRGERTRGQENLLWPIEG